MKQGINLALGKKSVDNALRKAFIVSVAFFCLTVIISLSLIVYRLVLKGSYDSLDAKEQKLNSQLLAMQDKKDKLIETKGRLSDVKKIIQRRLPTNARISTVSELIPEDSTVDTLNGVDNDMQVTLSSDNLPSLNELVEQKIEAIAKDKKKSIKKVEMRSFGLDPKTLKYRVTFGLTFN